MKIIYLVNARIPTEKAHGWQIMKTCETLARVGATVELVVPTRKNNLTADPFLYYGVEKNFTIKKLSVPDTVAMGMAGFYLQTFLFALAATFYCLRTPADVIYSRDVVPLFCLRRWQRTVLEAHAVPTRFFWLYRRALGGITKIISTNEWKKNFLQTRGGVSSKRIVVLPNAVDAAAHQITVPRAELCPELGLVSDYQYVIYTGHLYEWKGAQVLVAAAELLPSSVRVLFVGGAEQEITDFKKQYGGAHCLFVGQKPHAEIAKYLKIAAVAVLPNVPVSEESRFATSPLKLFEYLASGCPVVASDLPSVREIIDEETAYLVAPGNPAELAAAITVALNNPEQAAAKARRAYELVRENTWEKRAEKILKIIL